MTIEDVLKKIEFEEKWLLNVGYNAYNIDIAFHTIKWAIRQLSTESENVGMCQQTVGEMSEKQADGDLISRTDLLNKIWQKEYGKDYDGVNMLDIPHIDIIKNMPSSEKTAEWKKISPSGIYECTNCSQNVMTSDISAYKHCHGCGSKIKGEEE